MGKAGVVACDRCNKRKIKCVSSTGSGCMSCLRHKERCTIRRPPRERTPKQDEIDLQGLRKKAGRDTNYLLHSVPEEVWHDCCDILMLNFSTEISFLHPLHFKQQMCPASASRDASMPDLQYGELAILGVLTLTTRFHPKLIASYSDPLAASEDFADLLAARIRAIDWENNALDVMHGSLMLALYEWSQAKRETALIYIVTAIRHGHFINLLYEDEDARTKPPPLGEFRRRTLWSCFIIDWMLSAEKKMPPAINATQEWSHLRLPCSSDQFLLGENVRTDHVGSRWKRESEPRVTINDDGVLALYIQLVEISNRISGLSDLPPSDSAHKLEEICEDLKKFQKALPLGLAYTPTSLAVHLERRNAAVYVSMHTLYSTCLILLYQESVPFTALRYARPSEPLGLEEVFNAARDIIEIARVCQAYKALPESPSMAFAVRQAAFICMHTEHYNCMHPSNSMARPRADHIKIASQLLDFMSPRSATATGYLETIKWLSDFFSEHKGEHPMAVSMLLAPEGDVRYKGIAWGAIDAAVHAGVSVQDFLQGLGGERGISGLPLAGGMTLSILQARTQGQGGVL